MGYVVVIFIPSWELIFFDRLRAATGILTSTPILGRMTSRGIEAIPPSDGRLPDIISTVETLIEPDRCPEDSTAPLAAGSADLAIRPARTAGPGGEAAFRAMLGPTRSRQQWPDGTSFETRDAGRRDDASVPSPWS